MVPTEGKRKGPRGPQVAEWVPVGLYLYMPEMETVPYLCIFASLGVFFWSLKFACFGGWLWVVAVGSVGGGSRACHTIGDISKRSSMFAYVQVYGSCFGPLSWLVVGAHASLFMQFCHHVWLLWAVYGWLAMV